MNLVVAGLSHKTAPVEVREQISFPKERIGEAIGRLKALPGIMECAILSTCNRVEVYGVVSETSKGVDGIRDFLASHQATLMPEELFSHFYIRAGTDAIGHLIRVSSSLDSMVVGEPQILGQVKRAFDLAQMHKGTGRLLNRLFGKAISVAKRIRTETGIGESAVSVGSVATELATKIFGKLEDKKVLLVGAGEVATLAARHLMQEGVRDVTIASRTEERAQELASHFRGRAMAIEDLQGGLSRMDIVICSAGAPHYLITPEMVKRALKGRRQPLILIDISVPRVIDPEINRINDIFLYDIDDLEEIVAEHRRARQAEIAQAESIIVKEIVTTAALIKTLDAVPTIVDIRQKAEQIRRAELERFVPKLASLSDEDRRLVEAMTQAIVNKLLHAPMVALKHDMSGGDGILTVETARRIFNLDGQLPHHPHHRDGTGDRKVGLDGSEDRNG
jgi:glutamyl-tRNA reductase